LRKSSIVIVACLMAVLSATATAKTSRRSHSRHSAAAARAAAARAATERSAAEVRAGRERIAGQIKALTHFVYLFGGIQKGMESAANRDVSPVTVAQNQQSVVKVRASISSVRQGLERLETDFRGSPALQPYSPYLTGVANFGEAAENQAAANRFDDAGRLLLRAVDQLADALAAMR